MRLGEALATCPSLALVDRDPATVEREWEEVLRRLEDSGFAVDPVEHGVVVFETRGVERLYGGVRTALERALDAVGSGWDPRIGAADAPVHGSRRRERRSTRSDPPRRREGGRVVPRPAPALAPPVDAGALRGARGPRPPQDRGARRAPGWRRGREARCRRAQGLGPRPRRKEGKGTRAEAGGGARRGARLPGGRGQRAHAAPGPRLAPRTPARPPRTSRPAISKARDVRPARRRRLVAARGDPARRHGRACTHARWPSGRSSRSSRRRSSSSGSRRSSSRSTRASSSRWSSPPGRRRPAACARACGRCVRARGQDRCAPWWRWRRGRGFRRRERCSRS